MKNLPNTLTLSRILLSITLIFIRDDVWLFASIYLFCGLSDVLDGFLARKMKIESLLGAKLDSVADFVMFLSVAVVLYLWNWIDLQRFIPLLATIFILRIINLLIIYMKFHQFGVIHTYGNKMVGILSYCVPIFYLIMYNFDFVWIAASIAMIASLEETIIVVRMKELDLNKKGLFWEK